MKVLASAPRAAPPAHQPFRQLLAEARAALHGPVVPPGLRRREVVTAAAVGLQQAVLTRARNEANVEVARLRGVRAEGLDAADATGTVRSDDLGGQGQRADERLIELIVRELTVEASRPGAPGPSALGGPPPPTPREPAVPQGRAQQVAALIETIERFVRSQRPGLALTLHDGFAARVELERIGPREVAVKLIGRHGPPAPEAVSRVRDELRARGLKVGALSVA